MANSGVKDGTVSRRVALYRAMFSWPVLAAALSAFAVGVARTTFLPYVVGDRFTKVNQASFLCAGYNYDSTSIRHPFGVESLSGVTVALITSNDALDVIRWLWVAVQVTTCSGRGNNCGGPTTGRIACLNKQAVLQYLTKPFDP